MKENKVGWEGGSVAKNKKRGALLCFSGPILNVRCQMASLPWRDHSEFGS